MADERRLHGRYFPIILRNRERTRDRSPSAESSEDESGEEDANTEDSEDEAAVNSDGNESGGEIAGRPRGILHSPSLLSEDGWGGEDAPQVESELRGTILSSIEGGAEAFHFEETEARATGLHRAYWSPPREDRSGWSDDESQGGIRFNKWDDLEAATEPTRPGGDLGHWNLDLRDARAELDRQAKLQEGEFPVEEETAVDVDMTTTMTGSRRNAVGQAIVPEHGSFCVFYELLGEHWRSDCSGNVNEEGYVMYCPLCNKKEHTLLDCKEIDKVNMKWLYNEIRRRYSRALFPMPWNAFDIMPEYWGRGNLPQTPKFAKERLQKLGKQAPGEIMPDSFWENPVPEST